MKVANAVVINALLSKNAEVEETVENAKFNVGDKVRDTRNGKIGTIVLDNPSKLTYTVDWGGSQTDVPKGYDYLVLANSTACNGMFNVGDIVKDKSYPLSGKFRIVQVNPDGTYAIKPIRGGAVTSEYEKYLVSANAVPHHNFKVGDQVVERCLYQPSKSDKMTVTKVNGDKITCSSLYAGGSYEYDSDELQYCDKRMLNSDGPVAENADSNESIVLNTLKREYANAIKLISEVRVIAQKVKDIKESVESARNIASDTWDGEAPTSVASEWKRTYTALKKLGSDLHNAGSPFLLY